MMKETKSVSFLLCVVAGVFASFAAESSLPVVDAEVPAGNAIVESVTADKVCLRQDMRDSADWFYWAFRVRGAAGRKIDFVFTHPYAGGPVSARGPAVTKDRGRTWSYAAEKTSRPNGFTYTFGQDENEVWFYQTIQYLPNDWEAFLARHAADEKKTFVRGVLCVSRKGRKVPCARFGRLDGQAKYHLLFTSRHHCGEATATRVLEGVCEAFFGADELGVWLRENVEAFVVPFVDYDGVVDGDQGKGRKPHDHNRDYTEFIYPETRAIRDWAALEAKVDMFIDFHCPWVREGSNEYVNQVYGADEACTAQQIAFGKILECVQSGALDYRQKDDVKWMESWNKPSNYTAGKSSTGWGRTALKGHRYSSSLEIPFSKAHDKVVDCAALRTFGVEVAKAIREYLSSSAETAHVTLSDKPTPGSTDPNHWWMKAAEYRDNEAKALRDADVVWMGDSIIHYFENPGPKAELWKKFFSGPGNGAPYLGLNFAIEGDTTDNLLWRMKKSLDKTCPKAIILNIGTNNNGKRSEKTETTEDTLKGLEKILHEIGCVQPQAKVFVYALFPRGKGVTDPCMIRNERVNEGLRKLCDGRRVVWCDIRRKFLKSDGSVDQALLEDRLHPAPKGYEVWLADVLPRLEETMKEFKTDKKAQLCWWERYAWRAYTELKPDEQRKAVAEIAKLGLKPGGCVTERVIPNVKMFDDYDRFPKAEKDIRFPSSLADFGVKDVKEVDVADFAGGWNPTDTTKCFQEAIDSDATTIHIRPATGPWYVGQVNLKSNKRLVIHKGVKILMWQDPAREFRDSEPIFSIKDCENVLIEGEGTGVDESYVGCYRNYEERLRRQKTYGKCAFVLVASRNIAFRNLRIAEAQDDAILFSGLGLPNVDTYLDNVVLDSNYRQAMSICNGDGVYCRRVTFSNTRGNAPTAGIDFEPPYEIAPNTGVYLFDCTFENNGGGALLFSTSTYAPLTVYAKRTRFRHCPAPTIDFLPRLGIYLKAGRKPYSKMVFEDCDFETRSDLPVFQLSCGPFFDFTVRNCRIACAAEKLSNKHDYVASPIQFALNRDFGKDGLKPEMTGVGTFENVVCTGYPKGTPPVSVSDELGLLDVRGALKGAITIDGMRHVLDDYVYTSPDRGVKRTAPVDVKKLLPPSDPKAHTHPPVLAWDGAWWLPAPKYTCLWFKDGKWNAQKPAKQPFEVSDHEGTPLAYQCDTESDSFQKFFANDRDVCVYFEVPAGGKPCKIRINWGGAELRDPAGNVIERVKPGTYLGRHTFVVKPSTDKAEIWSLRFPKGSGIGVMRFYPPLTGVWAQSEGELPCVFREHHIPAKVAKSVPFDPFWGDRFEIAYDATKPLVDRSKLSAAQIAALVTAIAARRELAAKKAWTKRFEKERDEIAALAKNAKTDGQRRDAELGARNLPPLERAAKIEATAAQENDNVRELAAWCQILAIEKKLSVEDLAAKGLGLVKGLIEYDDVAALVNFARLVR